MFKVLKSCFGKRPSFVTKRELSGNPLGWENLILAKNQEIPSNVPVYLVCGLGNPGVDFEYSRHNAGFMVFASILPNKWFFFLLTTCQTKCVDSFAEKRNLKWFYSAQHKSQLALAAKKSTKQDSQSPFSSVLVLAKPQTFMNLSGDSVRPLLKHFKVSNEHLLVICDCIDLPFGELRMRPSGGHGGQNGVKDIISKIGSNEFARLRIGISRPKGKEVSNHVLNDFGVSSLTKYLRTIYFFYLYLLFSRENERASTEKGSQRRPTCKM